MYESYFPACPVEGAVDPPVPFAHMVLRGAVPNKCAHCKSLFEGECTRFMDEVQRYLHLDHGPCGVPGATDPVEYEDEYLRSKVSVPRKCASCQFLSVDRIQGFHCSKDAHIWGDFPRGLDWGSWEPESVYLQLPLPKVTTRVLSKYAKDEDLLSFIQEHRRINPGLSIVEAKSDYEHFRSILSGVPKS